MLHILYKPSHLAVRTRRMPLNLANAWFHNDGSAQHPLQLLYRSCQRSRHLSGASSAGEGGKSRITVNFKDKTGATTPIETEVGKTILEVAHKNGIDLEGACESSMACSTCHVILEEDFYDRLPEPCEEEDDMLDMAFGLTSTSRLGCQVVLGPGEDGTTITLPAATRNFYVDGHKPTPH